LNDFAEKGPAMQRVMCVEDDADIRMILDFSLGGVGGLTVLCCDGGAAALQQVPSFQPELVVLDVMMPGMSGPETLAALRLLPQMAGVPVVFLTAKATPGELEHLLQYGATGVIVKPFDPMSLAKDLRMYWEFGRGQA
jgi:CheY-like chemotaxis protein